ncbi:hypothetical protein ACFQ21_20270 [Ohtaekwangia kribbensis]|uniref:HEXXH motif-containing protein n=1 Tax=Ohtaekwangia kribbensis TaxID=688913 RepID=A0ABW3K6M8_9BACT
METIYAPTLSNIKLGKDTLRMHSQSHEDKHQTILRDFKGVLLKKWNMLIELLEKTDTNALTKLQGKISQLSEDQFTLIIMAPEVSFRLLNFNEHSVVLLTNFIIYSMDAELAKTKEEFDTNSYEELWTPNGDFFIRYNKEDKEFVTYEPYKLNWITPIDFFSPYCVKLTNDDVNETRTSKLLPYDFDEAESICNLLEETVEPLIGINNDYIKLINHFSRVIIFNKVIPVTGPPPFISGSDALHVGRTVISNPTDGDLEKMIEALVHESIHSKLYMIDETKRWMPSYDLSNKIGRVIPSSWTGNILTLNSLLQACFVWYGLYHFWSYAYQNNLYNEEHAVGRMNFIQAGFRKFDANELITKYNLKLEHELALCFSEIREEMLAN